MPNQILSQQNSDENENNKNNEIINASEPQTNSENQTASQKQENEKQLLVTDENKEISNIEVKVHTHRALKISLIILGIIVVLAVIAVTAFSVVNNKDTNIKQGISIEGIDVSNLSKESAKQKVQTEFLDKLDNTMYFQYGESQYSLALEQIDVKYKLDEAIEKAYSYGRSGSLIAQDIQIIKLKKQPENIKIEVSYDEIALDACIVDISAKLPEQVEQPSYYIEDGNLIITSGKIGKAALNDETKQIISDALNNKNFKDVYYDIPTYDKYPDEIDVDKIHSEIYREVKDAYYTVEPRMVYADETGVDFQESVETVKEQIASEKKSEYEVPLKYTPANVTVNDIGQDAFPDQLATTSTVYVNNANRTTNLRLAANKINGTVLMPGETFSYNTIVGERTIAAGYRNAAIYENGQVVDGLGGGICQVSSTLYNSVLKTNLEIVERTNHMFLTTYSPGGLDATVAYGSLDFKFKNNRSYPIKIAASVENGYCTVQIYGLRTDDDYQIELSSRKIGAYLYQSYKTFYKNGQFVRTEPISTDSYSPH